MELFSESLKKEHILSKIDARVKLLVVLALLVMILSYKGFLFPSLIILLGLFLWAMLKIPFRVLLMRLSEPLLIAAMVICLKLFFSGHLPLFSVNILGFQFGAYRDGLIEGLAIGARIIAAVSILAILGFCTPFTDFLSSLSWLRVPRGLIEIMFFAYRYIFVLLDEGTVIYNAQKTRLGYSSLRLGLSSFGTLAGSLILKAFEHSQNTAVAMVQRGYDGNLPVAAQKPFKPSEVLGSAIFTAGMVCLWMI